MKKYNIKSTITFSNEEENVIENIFNNKIEIANIDEHFLKNHHILNIIGFYYKKIKKDYVMMKKYYLMAIELGNSNAMNNLGLYYEKIEKDYVLMKKYYLMAIELGETNAMNNLGLYYYIKKDYELMKKYFLMAIELDNTNAMINLGFYYGEIEKDYVRMNKYYLMNIELGNLNDINYIIKYYHYDKKILKLYELLINVKNKNNLINNKINELEKIRKIQIYKNKIILFEKLKNYTKCPLCLEDNVLNIDLNCGHEVCISCYDSNLKCYHNWCKD